MVEADEILKFWFADAADSPAAAAARGEFWFQVNEKVDRQIWFLFADTLSDAASGLFDVWAEEPDGRLALIILLDQCPRNMYRGTAEVFRHDPRAMALAREGVECGQLESLSVPEQLFFLLPYQHSEKLAIQKAGVELYEIVAAKAADEWRAVAEGYRDFAVRHYDIIAQFGRFPHRNQVLGRQSSGAEERYLAGGGDTFGQAGQAG
jgi:uncharacterized protein (DUF924 family)